MECDNCGIEFTKRMARQKFCSSICKKRFYSKSVRIIKDIYSCKYCSKEFIPKAVDRITYCSRECAFEDKRARPKEKTKPVCCICGKQFEGRPDARYCSEECRKEIARQKGRQYWRTYKAASVVNEHTVKACKECGKSFITNFMASVREYCSDTCARRRFKDDYKKQRKEQLKKAFVKPVYFSKIYMRDKGMCQICGKLVDYNKSPEDPMGATIDHVVPLSIGGKHHPDNCQLAHRRCNSIKGTNIEFKIEA